MAHRVSGVTRISSLLVALAISSVAPSAFSQDPAAIAKARERFREGAALQAAGDWGRALEAYKDVALVKSSATVRFNIATCEEKLGDYVRAVGSYRLALTEATRSNAKDIETAVQKALDDLTPRIPTLVVRRGDGASVAEVSLDGRPLAAPSIGVEFQVNPGPHTLRATAPDREPLTLELNLADRERRAIEVVLKPRVGPAPDPTVPVGKQTPEEPPPPQKGNPTVRIAGFAVGGAGAASLIASGVFFGLRQKAISDLDAICGANRMSCPVSAKSTRDSGAMYSTVSTATFAAGLGALAIGGTLVLVSTRMKAPVAKSNVGLTLTPTGAILDGSF